MKYHIDKKIPIPYYYQIQQQIIDTIENSEWKPDEFIPSERELSDKFRVSRITTRKALDNLMIEGYIKKIKGKGAVVAKPRIEEQLFNKLIGTFQDLKDKGFDIKNKILSFGIIKAEKNITKELGLSENEGVVKFERLRYIDNEPYHFSRTFMPEKICPDFKEEFLIDNSLIQVLEKKYGLKIYKVKRILQASVATIEDSKLFEIKIGSPILTFFNTAYIKDGTAIEYTLNKIRGDMSKFEIEISSEKVEDMSHIINKNN